MTLLLFRLLSPAKQLHYVLAQGTYLLQRWEGDWDVLLYHLPDGGRGFFAEVGLAPAQANLVVRRSFASSELLEDYTPSLPFPGEE
jgi:hypothetical protein